jgi:hypothetical protein
LSHGVGVERVFPFTPRLWKRSRQSAEARPAAESSISSGGDGLAKRPGQGSRKIKCGSKRDRIVPFCIMAHRHIPKR